MRRIVAIAALVVFSLTACVSHYTVPLHINGKDFTCQVKDDPQADHEIRINYCDPAYSPHHPDRQANN